MFVITTVRHGNDAWTCMDVKAVGIFDTKKKAFEVLENNTGDLTDYNSYQYNYYQFAVIEEIEFGLYPEPKLIRCYQWNEEDENWQKYTEMPAGVDRFCPIG